MTKKLCRSKKDRKVSGVCAGLANYFGADPTIVRLIWAVLTLVSMGTGIIIYIIAFVIIPEESDYIDANFTEKSE